MNTQAKDNLFAQKDVKSFVFDADVTRVFEDMIKRSVPGYGLTLQMISLIAAQYAQAHSKLYDLGCSLGASTLAMSHAVQGRDCSIVGVDNSEAMLKACAINVQASPTPVHLLLGNIEEVDIADASVVVLNFTLQFIAKEKRDALMQKIYAGMRPGGVLVLSEKVAFDDDFEQEAQIQLHESFKKAQGYSEMEVSRKRQSIENVLIPETMETHHARLEKAGFAHSQTWFQCFNFVSMLAYK
ncbi:MAG: carboxy-S-adenosyl-L-methionine synthase CmoA [Zetaproteobacteria bacterium CG2_30_46_52]|nr:MAG: carboxy-S-adenosyl-L-methionine synthase CmoA [Zetaproteobacteria bacterium CG2_30_46_52]